jgi:putative transposase
MKKSRFSEHQIVQILKQADAGIKTADICRQYGISETTYYNWKTKYGGMESSDIKRLRELEAENQRLKRMYAELSLDHQILKEIVEKKL